MTAQLMSYRYSWSELRSVATSSGSWGNSEFLIGAKRIGFLDVKSCCNSLPKGPLNEDGPDVLPSYKANSARKGNSFACKRQMFHSRECPSSFSRYWIEPLTFQTFVLVPSNPMTTMSFSHPQTFKKRKMATAILIPCPESGVTWPRKIPSGSLMMA